MIVDEFGFLPDSKLLLPRGRKGLPPFTLDLSAVSTAEKRIPEMARATPLMLPDLITAYNIGILALARLICVVELETKDARRELEDSKALFIIDFADDILRQKNIKS